MKNFLYGGEISERMKELLERDLPNSTGDMYKYMHIGDLSILPQPEDLHGELPCIIITLDNAKITAANKSMHVYHQRYDFSVHYIYALDLGTDDDYVDISRSNSEKIVNVLMNATKLDDFIVLPDGDKAGGAVIDSEVTNIAFATVETEFFRRLNIPAAIGNISFAVEFRTFRANGRM